VLVLEAPDQLRRLQAVAARHVYVLRGSTAE